MKFKSPAHANPIHPRGAPRKGPAPFRGLASRAWHRPATTRTKRKGATGAAAGFGHRPLTYYRRRAKARQSRAKKSNSFSA